MAYLVRSAPDKSPAVASSSDSKLLRSDLGALLIIVNALHVTASTVTIRLPGFIHV
jgi:hypothetical protein